MARLVITVEVDVDPTLEDPDEWECEVARKKANLIADFYGAFTR